MLCEQLPRKKWDVISCLESSIKASVCRQSCFKSLSILQGRLEEAEPQQGFPRGKYAVQPYRRTAALMITTCCTSTATSVKYVFNLKYVSLFPEPAVKCSSNVELRLCPKTIKNTSVSLHCHEHTHTHTHTHTVLLPQILTNPTIFPKGTLFNQ